VSYANHHHDDRLAFWCAAPPGAQEVLAGAEPERFFRPPYVGTRGWLGVYLGVPVDWPQVEGWCWMRTGWWLPGNCLRSLTHSRSRTSGEPIIARHELSK
jgi:hypothetical protein